MELKSVRRKLLVPETVEFLPLALVLLSNRGSNRIDLRSELFIGHLGHFGAHIGHMDI